MRYVKLAARLMGILFFALGFYAFGRAIDSVSYMVISEENIIFMQNLPTFITDSLVAAGSMVSGIGFYLFGVFGFGSFKN